MSSRARERRSPARPDALDEALKTLDVRDAPGPPPTRRRPSVPALERAFASPGRTSSASSPASSSSPAASSAVPSASSRSTPHAPAMSPAAALRTRREHLSAYEQGEIGEYPQIWYCGDGVGGGGKKPGGRAKKPSDAPGADLAPGAALAHNHGFDDERGDYGVTLRDHLAYRYEILEIVGKGSFGKVLRCFDHKTGSHAAVKVIRNKKRFHHQALVEVKILERLRHARREASAPGGASSSSSHGDGGGCVEMREYFYFRNHLCIAFELLSSNLYEFCKTNGFRGLSLGLCRRFAGQLLRSLRFLRAQRIIHCDLKPENVLLERPNKSAIKLVDFGSSCFEDERAYTYIQSRFYRAPEVILGTPYDQGIDMWSLGCVLAELYAGRPLFPGENEAEQLARIMEVIGAPPPSALADATRAETFFRRGTGEPKPATTHTRDGKRRIPGSRDLAEVLRCTDRAFVSFIEKCLRWNARDRLTPERALKHEWIAPQPQESDARVVHRDDERRASAAAEKKDHRDHRRRRQREDADATAKPAASSSSEAERHWRVHARHPRGAAEGVGFGYAAGGLGTSRTRAALLGGGGGEGRRTPPRATIDAASAAARYSGLRARSTRRATEEAKLPSLSRRRS